MGKKPKPASPGKAGKTRRDFLKRAYLPPTIIALGQPLNTLGSPPPPPGGSLFFDPRGDSRGGTRR